MPSAVSETAATAESATTMKDQPEDWCISIKTVGGGFDDDSSGNESKNANISSSGERLFSIKVSPEDGVASLYQEVEGATGVKASQQRLIYRGRIINDHPPLRDDDEDGDSILTEPKNLHENESSNSVARVDASLGCDGAKTSATVEKADDPRRRKIKDIAGLCDGQTIHLVKKRETTSSDSSDDPTPSSSDSNSPTTSGPGSFIEAAAADLLGGSSTGGGGNSGGAFMAALLGLGSLGEEESNTDTNATTAASSTPATTSAWRSSRRSNRRPHYRLAAADLEVPDPGSMEPVRQGLMTLHTLLPHSELHRESGTSPLEANREWFRGQWLDCRDTVNQWLEATVVEILRPRDLLPADAVISSPSIGDNEQRRPTVDNDPVVSANDLEGRRRLLLQPCSPGDPHELSGVMAGYRPRPNNNGLQLLLIHYNGWPHRWDEWIRSDSERIRPFRTRTRHPNSSTNASPTPQSVFSDAPRTNMSIGDEHRDRAALLPELNRAISQVNGLLGELVQRGQSCDAAERVSDRNRQRPDEDLPWIAPAGDDTGSFDEESDDEDYINAEMSELESYQPRSNIVVPTEDVNDGSGTTASGEILTGNSAAPETNSSPSFSRRELRHLATVLDRLGRTLTDAAPHVASLAGTLPEDIPAASSSGDESASDAGSPPETEHSTAPLGGLLSLWSRERRRQNIFAGHRVTAISAPRTVDPDHVDFASGLVNTTRGEVRSGPRSRPSQDDFANLLGAYLAAASLSGLVGGEDNGDDNLAGLGRLLSRGGNGGGNGGNGGGIDIHIHAVVTTGGTGGTGLVGMGGLTGAATGSPTGTLGGATARSIFSGARSSRSLLRSRQSASASNHPAAGGEEDNDDLFSELYSENPSPVDPNGSPGPRENGNAAVSLLRSVPSSASSDLSGTFEGRAMGSMDSTPPRQPSSRFSSVPHRRQSSNRHTTRHRSSGMFRLFRRRSRSNQSDRSS